MRRVSTLVLRTEHAFGVGGWIRCSHSMYLASSRVATLLRVHFDVAAAVDWLDNADRLFATADIAKRGSTMNDFLSADRA